MLWTGGGAISVFEWLIISVAKGRRWEKVPCSFFSKGLSETPLHFISRYMGIQWVDTDAPLCLTHLEGAGL
ncbi:MAG: hypothetical protein DWC09_02355 [Candidatus Poseidoniales archaeon]|nr:MAG: hypothetical protein DWC09_02355 [Candidatus Poseidoniales archaeon]